MPIRSLDPHQMTSEKTHGQMVTLCSFQIVDEPWRHCILKSAIHTVQRESAEFWVQKENIKQDHC